MVLPIAKHNFEAALHACYHTRPQGGIARRNSLLHHNQILNYSEAWPAWCNPRALYLRRISDAAPYTIHRLLTLTTVLVLSRALISSRVTRLSHFRKFRFESGWPFGSMRAARAPLFTRNLAPNSLKKLVITRNKPRQ